MEVTSVRRIKSVCVFCGSNPGKDKEFVNIAHHLGRVLAKREIHLVYGGGSLGLMGCVAGNPSASIPNRSSNTVMK